jgi:hypothetical protein
MKRLLPLLLLWVVPDTRVRLFEERRANGKMGAPLSSTELSWLMAPPDVGDQRLKFYAMLLVVGVFAKPAEECDEAVETPTKVRFPPGQTPKRMALMNSKQLQDLGFGATLLRSIKIASRLFR